MPRLALEGNHMLVLASGEHSPPANVESVPARINLTRMWANAQRDGRPAAHTWRPLFNAAKFG